jgi:hypothetical protein
MADEANVRHPLAPLAQCFGEQIPVDELDPAHESRS